MESAHRHSPEPQRLTPRTPPLPIYGGESRTCDTKSCDFSNVKIFFLNRATKAREAGFKASKESGRRDAPVNFSAPAHPRRLLCQPSQHRVRHRYPNRISCGRRLLPNQHATRKARHRHFGLHFPIRQPRCSLPLGSIRRILFGHPSGECQSRCLWR